MANTAWCTWENISALWPGVNSLDWDTVQLLMKAAQEQCEAFAPVLASGAPVPTSYTVAVAMQARNLWNASKVDSGTFSIGEGEFAYQPRPLDWAVKQQLRPKTGRPLVG